MPRVTVARFVLALACVLGTCTGARATERPNIIVILVDTLRSDRLGVNGNPNGLTPFLDSLARRGTVFANAYAPSSWTYPSIASLFTSRYPSQHRMVSYDSVLSADEVTLAEVLAEKGYVAAGFCANFRVNQTGGYAQGFARWDSYLPEPGEAKPHAALLRQKALNWLDALPDAGTHPLLLYPHYMEPHAPYVPPEPYRSRFAKLPEGFDAQQANGKLVAVGGGGLRGLTRVEIDALASLYDGAVAEVDAEIRSIMGDLEERGFLRNAIVVITADHGEEFGEHGELVHGTTLFQPAIRIPLIVVATQMAAGNVVFENVSLIDIAPTLLDLVGAGPAASFEGRSLQTLMRREDSSERQVSTGSAAVTGDVLSELELFQPKFDVRVHARTLISGTRKVLVSKKGSAVMFDLARDPDELAPGAIDSSPSTADSALLQQLEQRRSALAQRRILAPGTQQLDDATKEKMRALGYGP